jgi:lactoylglutathione lyase
MTQGMVPVRALFEGHLFVGDLARSMAFYGDVLGLELAHRVSGRVAFYWIGGRGEAMLGLWEAGAVPHRLSLHLAFNTNLDDLLQAPALLKRAGVTPRDFSGNPTDEPEVLAWMPAASVYFHDPDGNLLEFLSMLPDPPEPSLGVVGWSRWLRRPA